MSGTQAALHGAFGPVHGPDGEKFQPASFSSLGTKSERKLVDMEEVPEEYKDALEAENFLIFGKASVEVEDLDGQEVDIDALEEALPQQMKSGLISRRHKDVRVGNPVMEHELDEDTQFAVGDEMLEFSSGDVLKSQAVKAGQEGPAGVADEDEIWIVANIWNDSEIAKDTRLRVMSGDLNGFSVTIFAKETESLGRGKEKVISLDWHATTIGSDDTIKNKEARFGLAEFKAMFTDDAISPATGLADVTGNPLKTIMWNGLFSKSADNAGFDGKLAEAATEASQKAQNDDMNLEEAAEEITSKGDYDGLDADRVVEAVNVLSPEADEKEGGDMEEVLRAVEEGELTAEEAKEIIASEMGGGDDEDEDGEMKEEDEEEDDEEEEEQKSDPEDTDDPEDSKSFEEKLNEHGVVTEDSLESKLDDQRESFQNDVQEMFDESIPTAEDIAAKADFESGSTDDPSGGSGQNQRDYTQDITERFGADEE